MTRLKAFQIKVNDQIFNYREGEKQNLSKVKSNFGKEYLVRKIWSGGRHIFGELERNNKTYFLKLATSEGISYLTKIEFLWNEQFNKLIPRNSSSFWVPKNFDSGMYEDKYFYLITDKLNGVFLTKEASPTTSTQSIIKYLPKIIELSELIQELDIANLSERENIDHQTFFMEKTNSWYNDIPSKVVEEFRIYELLKIVSDNYCILEQKPRHGDFTPWHIMTQDNRLLLLDGEHAISNGVEYYDIGYFIQRVFSVLEDKTTAEEILLYLKKMNYNITKLKTILAARAIGGFLDESFKDEPNYKIASDFKKWVTLLN